MIRENDKASFTLKRRLVLMNGHLKGKYNRSGRSNRPFTILKFTVMARRNVASNGLERKVIPAANKKPKVGTRELIRWNSYRNGMNKTIAMHKEDK